MTKHQLLEAQLILLKNLNNSSNFWKHINKLLRLTSNIFSIVRSLNFSRSLNILRVITITRWRPPPATRGRKRDGRRSRISRWPWWKVMQMLRCYQEEDQNNCWKLLIGYKQCAWLYFTLVLQQLIIWYFTHLVSRLVYMLNF